MADKELDSPLCDGLGALVDKVDALEVAEVVCGHPGQEALQLPHVEGTGHVGPVGAGQRPAAAQGANQSPTHQGSRQCAIFGISIPV